MRSWLAWKLRRNGRSTVTLRYPKAVVGSIRLTVIFSGCPSRMTVFFAPSLPSASSRRISTACSWGISRRLSPRLRRMETRCDVASINCTKPFRCGVLRFVSSQT